MQQPDKVEGYLEEVRRQIRWKRAQETVLEELREHIEDQAAAFRKEGLDEEAAAECAVQEMGDPVEVGSRLDRIHRPRPDRALFALVAALLALGLAAQKLTGPGPAGSWMAEDHIIGIAVGVAAMLAAYFADFTLLAKYPITAYFAVCAVSAACFLAEGGHAAGVRIASVYPLLLFPAAFSGFVYGMRGKSYGGLLLCSGAFLIPAFLAVLAPSLTALFLLCVSCLVLLTCAVAKGWFGVRKRWAILILYLPVAGAVSALLARSFGGGYAAKRIQTAFNPSLDPMGDGYLGMVVRQLLSHARFIGEGLPVDYGGLYGTRLLPEINTDFLLTYLIYRFGWIVLVGVLALFAAFLIRAGVLCKRQKSALGFMVSLSVVLVVALECLLYLAANLGFLLLSSLSLPLISYGRAAMAVNMLLIGLLLSVFRTGALVRDGARSLVPRSFRPIRYEEGKIIIELRHGASD